MKNLSVLGIAIFASNVLSSTSFGTGCSFSISGAIRYGRECEKVAESSYRITKCDEPKAFCMFNGKISDEKRPCNGQPGPGFQSSSVEKVLSKYSCKRRFSPHASGAPSKQVSLTVLSKKERQKVVGFFKTDCVSENLKNDNVNSVVIFDANFVFRLTPGLPAVVEEEIPDCT